MENTIKPTTEYLVESLDLANYWAVIRYYWASIILIICLVLGLIFTVSLLMTPIYQSKATLLLTESEGQITLKDDMPEFIRGYSVEPIASLGTTTPVLNNVITKLNLDMSPETLKGLVKVTFNEDKEAIGIQVENASPAKAQQIAQTLAESLIIRELRLQQADAEARNIYLKNQMAKMKEELIRSEEKLKLFQEREGIFELDNRGGSIQPRLQTAILLDKYYQLQSLLASARIDLEATRLRIASIEAQLGMKTEEIENLFSNREGHPQQKKLNELEIKLAHTLAQHLKNDSIKKEIEESINRFKASMLEAEDEDIIKKFYQDDPVRQRLLLDYVREKVELATMTVKIEAIKKGLEERKSELDQIPDKQLLLARLERDRAINEDTYQMLREKYEETRLEKESEVGSLQIIEPASLPKNPIRPNIPKNLSIALVFGLILALGTAFLREYFDKSIKSLQELEDNFKYPVLGCVPFLPWKKEIIDVKYPHSGVAEIYRILTHDAYEGKEHYARTILFASAHQGEGKSTTCLNFALSSVMGGKKVVILEIDIRQPSLAKKLNLKKVGYGFQDYLSGKADLNDILTDVGIPGLKLILAKREKLQDPADILTSPRLSELIQRLKKEVDILYIDSPAVLPLIDVSLLGEEVDGIIFIVQGRGPATINAVKFALTRLQRMHSHIIGLLLTKIKLPRKERHYYYYYRHHLNLKERLVEGLSVLNLPFRPQALLRTGIIFLVLCSLFSFSI